MISLQGPSAPVFCHSDTCFGRTYVIKIKLSIFIFDELLFEHGTFEATLLDSASHHMYYPPGMVPDNKRGIDFQKDIENARFSMVIGLSGGPLMHTIMDGTTNFRFKVDYYDVFRNIIIDNCPFIKIRSINDNNFPNEAKRLIAEIGRADTNLLNPDYSSGEIAIAQNLLRCRLFPIGHIPPVCSLRVKSLSPRIFSTLAISTRIVQKA